MFFSKKIKKGKKVFMRWNVLHKEEIVFCPQANLPVTGNFARPIFGGIIFCTIDHRQTL